MRSLALITLVFCHLVTSVEVDAAERFGGVEIGAKGIKASAVEVDGTGAEATLKVLELDKKTVDVTIARLKGKNFQAVLVEDAAEVVKNYVEVLKSELNVPDANIQVVASSGVPFANNFADLVTAIRDQTGKDLEKIDAVEEATLTAVALVPKELRTRALVIDIGSGNTKGGAFLDDSGEADKFAPLDAPFGTATLTKAIDEAVAAAPGSPRDTVARDVSRQLVGDRLRSQLDDKPVLGERDQVLFSGGSVWAFVTIMKPETGLNQFPKVTAADIKAYVALINKTPGKYPEIDFARVTDAAARKVAEDDYARICGTSGGTPIFKPEELQTGAALLEQVSGVMNFPKRVVRFDRKAVTAWITARITPAEYRHLLPAAFGRKIEVEEPAANLPIKRFGGVEIGAKGIKASAVEVDATGAEATLKVLELDNKTINVAISRLKDKDFKTVLIEDAAEVVKDFVEALKSELSVPDENIQVVASSGVPFASNFADLVAAVRDRTGKELEKIDVVEEATLTALALVPKKLRTRALVIDIGSGNTKGGAFLDESGTSDQFAPLDAPFGTATLTKAIDEKTAAAPEISRESVARETGRQLVGDRLRQQLKEKPDLKERDQVFLAGGAVWAFATIMKPEAALEPFVKVTATEVRAYFDLINKTPGKYPEIDFARVTDEAARKAAGDDYARICGTSGKPPIFTPDGLQAGAVLLGQVSGALNFSNHAVRFDRKAMTAWITARITPAEHRHLLPSAFGRDIPEVGWPPEPSSIQRFAGIEIGAKGIKAAAVEIGQTTEPTLKVLKLKQNNVNVTIAKRKGKDLTIVKIEDTTEVVKDFVNALEFELGVPEDKIQIVASSGVPLANNFADLVAAIRDQTGRDLVKIDAAEEATLTALGMVPLDFRTRAFVIDIGSGNTKGGAFLDESGAPDQFATVDAPFGATTLSERIDEDPRLAMGIERASIARELSKELVGDALKKQLDEKPEFAKRNQALLLGGSVWAFVTIMKPESVKDSFPEVTALDVKNYVERINKTPGQYPEVNFSGVADAEARTNAEGDYAKICGTSGNPPIFTPDELQAGAVLLEEVVAALDVSKRSIRFDRQSRDAWITTRITPVEYRHLLPEVSRVIKVLPVKQAAINPPDTQKENAPPKPPITPPPSDRDHPVQVAKHDCVPCQTGCMVPTGVAPVACDGFFAYGCDSCWSRGGLRYHRPRVYFAMPGCGTYLGCSTCNPVSGISPCPSATCSSPRVSEVQPTFGFAATTSSQTITELSPHRITAVQVVSRVESPSPESLVQEFQKRGRPAGDLFGAGMTKFRQKNYVEAVSYFTAATLLSDDARFWHFRGLCERELGRLSDAERSVAHGWALIASNPDAGLRVSFALEEVQGKRRAWLEETKRSTNRAFIVQSDQ